MKTKLGRLEAQLLAYTQMRRQQVVATGDLLGPLRITPKQERELLSRMSRAGIIAQVRRGLYLVPPQLPLGGSWTPDEMLALTTLISAAGARYQICGPSAFSRYGFDEQMPAGVCLYNNRLSGQRQIGAVALTLIEVADERLGDTTEIKTAEGKTAVYSSRARTLLDAVYDWSRFASLPRAYEWIRRDLAAKKTTPADLIRVTLRYGNQGTIRRMGALLEQLGVPAKRLAPLRNKLEPTTALIPWVPGLPKRGPANGAWGVVLNERA